MFACALGVQLRLAAHDRLVELVEERRGHVAAEEAARVLFALRAAPVALARSLLEETVRADSRLAWSGDHVRLARAPGEAMPLEGARFVVFDLEATGLTPSAATICGVVAVRIEALLQTGAYQALANPGRRLPLEVAA